MKFFLIIACVTFLSLSFCHAQTTTRQKQTAVSFELGKTGLIYNLSIDHKLAVRNIGFRFIAGTNLGSYLTLNIFGGGVYYLMGKKASFFELGLDVQYLIVNETSDDQRGFAEIFTYPDYPTKTVYPSLNFGYRRYGKNTMFRMGLSPGIIKKEFIPGSYISFGIAF